MSRGSSLQGSLEISVWEWQSGQNICFPLTILSRQEEQQVWRQDNTCGCRLLSSNSLWHWTQSVKAVFSILPAEKECSLLNVKFFLIWSWIKANFFLTYQVAWSGKCSMVFYPGSLKPESMFGQKNDKIYWACLKHITFFRYTKYSINW